MGWATTHIAKLQAGETVSFRPHGNSMQPKIQSGQLCTLEPIGPEVVIEVGDIVLCKVNGKQFLHLVKAVGGGGGLYQIGNNKGHVNGWCSRKSVFGRLIRIEP